MPPSDESEKGKPVYFRAPPEEIELFDRRLARFVSRSKVPTGVSRAHWLRALMRFCVEASDAELQKIAQHLDL